MPIDFSRTFTPLAMGIITVSDSRNDSNDTSGDRLAGLLTEAGHALVGRQWVRDDESAIIAALEHYSRDHATSVVLLTGGTGVTGRDVTPEAVRGFAAAHRGKEVAGFGELFRMLSFQKIGTSALQSRAIAFITSTLTKGMMIFALPGSPSAVKDAWEMILQTQLDSRFRPCNFAELLPRMKE